MSPHDLFRIATRGSALALVQANQVLAACRRHFPGREFSLNVIKTTGDALQTAAPESPAIGLPKGLFTKELEVSLLDGGSALAVHSLKDLPTELPPGLALGAAGEREDPRDVLLYRSGDLSPHASIRDLPKGVFLATSSTRRQAQATALRPDLDCGPIRGNVGTRLRKLKENQSLFATILAMAGLRRLGFRISEEGELLGEGIPEGILATPLALGEMLPCPGQAAIGLEIREGHAAALEICGLLNHAPTFQCVTAERAFLHAMGGGCLSPVAALATLPTPGRLRLEAVSFQTGAARRAAEEGDAANPGELGRRVAALLG